MMMLPAPITMNEDKAGRRELQGAKHSSLFRPAPPPVRRSGAVLFVKKSQCVVVVCGTRAEEVARTRRDFWARRCCVVGIYRGAVLCVLTMMRVRAPARPRGGAREA